MRDIALPWMMNLPSLEHTIKKRDGLSLYVVPIMKRVAGASVRAGRLSDQKCLVRRSNCFQSRCQNLKLLWRHRIQVCRDDKNRRGSTCEPTIWRSQIERAASRSIGRINVIRYGGCESCASKVRKRGRSMEIICLTEQHGSAKHVSALSGGGCRSICVLCSSASACFLD